MRSLSTALLLGLVFATNAACSEDPTSPAEGQTEAGGAGGAGAAGGAATGGGTSAGGASATGGAGGMGQGGGLPLPEGCPDLSGVFSCPPYGNQSEFTLTVTVVVQDASVVSYTLEYSNTGQSHTDVASAAGISAGGYTYQCVDYQGAPSLAVYPDGKPQSATQNFINADGDYEADFGGSTAIVCARQP